MRLKKHSFAGALFLLAVAIASAHCGSGSTTTLLGPTDQRCALTIAPGTATADAAGATGSLTVTTSRECQWTASVAAAWIRLNTTAGQGTGTVSYEVDPNRSTTSRSAIVTVGDVKTTVTQQGAGCPFAVSPDHITIGPAGGELIASLSTEDFCSWNAASQAGWISVSSSTGAGSAELQVRVEANTGAERLGVVMVGNASLSITQPAPVSASQTCSASLSSSAGSIAASGGSLTTTVTTASGCTSNATSSAPWVTVLNPTGSGSRTISLSVAANTGTARTGTVSIAGVAFTISQGGAAPPPTCTFNVAPTSFTNVAAAGSTLDVTVTAAAGCSWTATPNQSWITIAQGATGSGNGTVRLAVQQNSGVLRSGTVTVAGQTVTVSQAAAGAPCTYAIAPSSYTAPVGGGSVQVSVTTTSSCAWSVSGLPAWISAAPASGSGNQTVSLTVQANSGSSRASTFTIATQSFTVNQAAAAICSYAINPSSFNSVAGSGAGTTVSITTTALCAWTVTGNPSWIQVGTAVGLGSGSTTVTVQPNPGGARNASFQIAGQTFSVSQQAVCTYTVNPSSFDLSSAEHTSTIMITTQSGCTAQATSSVSWIQITTPPPTGGGNLVFHTDKNIDQARNGSITITGQSFTKAVTISQHAK